MARENVVLVTFEEESTAYQAVTVLKVADADERIGLHAVAVVQRMKTARLGSRKVTRTPSPSLPGLRGRWCRDRWCRWPHLGRPWRDPGASAGRRGGMLLGSLIDLDSVEEAESVLGTMARAIQPGKTALLAEATEPAVEVVDTEMERLGGKVVRRPVVDVEAEIAAAEAPQGPLRRKRGARSGSRKRRSAGRRSRRRSTSSKPNGTLMDLFGQHFQVASATIADAKVAHTYLL